MLRIVLLATSILGSFVPSASYVTHLWLSMISPAPMSSRIAQAEVIVVGRYIPLGTLEESLVVDHVLIDARPSAQRRTTPPQRIKPLQSSYHHDLSRTKLSWILLWGSSRKHDLGYQIVPILAPAYVEECDRMLDELADSLAESKNPNFGAVGRFLIAERERLPMQYSHAFRKVVVTP
jgi:hypothetical protein